MKPVKKGEVIAVKKGHLIELWLAPANDPEGELLMDCAASYVPEIMFALDAFMRVERRRK